MSINVRIILSLSCLALFLLFSLIYKVVVNRHRRDPKYMEEQRKRDEEYRKRQQEENDRLAEEYMQAFSEYESETDISYPEESSSDDM